MPDWPASMDPNIWWVLKKGVPLDLLESCSVWLMVSSCSLPVAAGGPQSDIAGRAEVAVTKILLREDSNEDDSEVFKKLAEDAAACKQKGRYNCAFSDETKALEFHGNRFARNIFMGSPNGKERGGPLW